MELRQRHGRDGEDIAVAFLQSKGYRVVTRNWRPAGNGMRGEIDIVAWDGRTLCFVEVKTRTSVENGAPQEAVNGAKQRQICRLANMYVSYFRQHEVACRFDVVEVWLLPQERLPRVALHTSAFDYQPGGKASSKSR